MAWIEISERILDETSYYSSSSTGSISYFGSVFSQYGQTYLLGHLCYLGIVTRDHIISAIGIMVDIQKHEENRSNCIHLFDPFLFIWAYC